MEFIQSIFVSREVAYPIPPKHTMRCPLFVNFLHKEAGSRQKAAAAIKERVCSSEDWPQVIIVVIIIVITIIIIIIIVIAIIVIIIGCRSSSSLRALAPTGNFSSDVQRHTILGTTFLVPKTWSQNFGPQN